MFHVGYLIALPTTRQQASTAAPVRPQVWAASLSGWGRQLCLGPGGRRLLTESSELVPHLPVHSANICSERGALGPVCTCFL